MDDYIFQFIFVADENNDRTIKECINYYTNYRYGNQIPSTIKQTEDLLKYNDSQEFKNKLLQYYTIEKNNEVIFRLLALGADPYADNDKVFELAVICGHKFLVFLYLDAGIDINKHIKLLNIAANKGHIEIIKIFIMYLPHNKDTQLCFNDAFISSVKNGHLPTTKLLIAFGVNINFIHDYALIIACKTNNYDMVKYLLESGCDVDAQGGRAVIEAVKNANIELIKLLYENGADTSNPCLMEFAINNNLFNIFPYLSCD